MARLLLSRLAQSIFLVLAVVSVVFFTTFVVGDPARIMLPPETSPEVYAAFRHQMGFDRPILVQYGDYISHALRGDFGDSWWQRTPALPIAARPLPATFQLAIAAILLAILLGLPMGLYASLHPGSVVDRLATLLSLLGVSIPLIWFCPMLIIIFAAKLRWLPTAGYGSWKNMVMPVVSLAILPLGRIVQITRASMIDELVKQYVTTARAKGLPQRIVLVRHALKNAILPVITVTGWEFILMVSGYTIIVETVFGWPGIGFMLYTAIKLRDMPLIAATAFVISVVVVIINFFVDILYGVANPVVRTN